MEDRTRDAVPTVDLGPSGERGEAPEELPRPPSAFDPPAQRFEAVGELGRGGMGRVDDAFDRALGRPVAIKHMLSTAEVDLARFEREARITARLEHPGIVPIHDAGRSPDGTPYYVMRRVDGKPLDLAIGKTLADRLATIPNVLAACDAVAFAHARGVVHRDIKPTNILVGPFGETLVIDWGLAREIGETDTSATILPSDPQLTRAGTVAGTPGFMAPEQARGEAVDARADVYALGATLYFVLAGRLPYDTASATEMVGLAGEGRAPNWRAISDDVPPELRAIAMKAMASDAGDRYPDAGALAADLRQFITGNLVAAYDYGPLVKFVRFVRRHRAAVAVAGVSALVVLVIAIIAVRRVVAERDDARDARALAEAKEQEAASTNDRLLVQHALEQANTDPIATIATLRTLPIDSTRWREARVAATAAYVRGIPFGFAGDAMAFQIDRDSKRAVVLGDRGQVSVIDLATRTRRVVTEVGRATSGVAWLGPTHVVCAAPERVMIVDVEHGTIRTLPLQASATIGDHASKVLLTTFDRRLIELTDPAGEPRELATHVVSVATSRDLSEAVIERETGYEVWTASGKHLHLADNPAPGHPWSAVVAINNHRVMTLEEGVVKMWRIVDDKLVPAGTTTERMANGIDIVGDRYLAFDLDGIVLLSGDRRMVISPISGVPYSSPRGFAMMSAGSIHLFDDRGWLHLGQRVAGLRRVEASVDGRFVLATTDSGTVLVWDLHALFPVRAAIARGVEFERMTAHALWLESMVEGTSRLDLATGERRLVIEALITNGAVVDPQERFAAVGERDHVSIFDASRQRPLEVPGTTFALDPGGLVIEHADGTLWRWQPGDDSVRPIGALGGPAAGISHQGNYVIARVGDHVERLELSGRRDTTKLDGIVLIGIQADGLAWFVLNDGSVWRWPLAGGPEKYPDVQRADTMTLNGNTAIIYTHEAIMMVRGRDRRVASIASSGFAWDGDATIVTMTTTGEVSVLDMETQLSYTLPVRGVVKVAVFGDRVATGDGTTTTIWDLEIPHDPRELQAWLQTVTNVKTIPGSEAYAWP